MPESTDERILTDVWDRPTRVLHWTIAVLVITLALLMIGNYGMEYLGVDESVRTPLRRLHAYTGYAFIIALALRLLWGFAGNAYARWTDIIPYGKERWRAAGHNIRWYLSGFRGRPAGAVGHAPFASVFYTALFIVLVSQAVTGLILAGSEFHMYPAYLFMRGMSGAGLDAVGDSVIGDVHALGFWFILFFLVAHLFGLVVHEVKEKTGLLSSMIHGKKYLPKAEVMKVEKKADLRTEAVESVSL